MSSLRLDWKPSNHINSPVDSHGNLMQRNATSRSIWSDVVWWYIMTSCRFWFTVCPWSQDLFLSCNFCQWIMLFFSCCGLSFPNVRRHQGYRVRFTVRDFCTKLLDGVLVERSALRFFITLTQVLHWDLCTARHHGPIPDRKAAPVEVFVWVWQSPPENLCKEHGLRCPCRLLKLWTSSFKGSVAPPLWPNNPVEAEGLPETGR